MNHSTRLAFSVGIVLLILGVLFAATANASSEVEPVRLSSPRVSAIAPPPPPVSYTLTIDKNGNGSVTPPSGTHYLSGTNATLSATADTCFKFNGWSGPVTGITNPLTIEMIADITETANFVPGTFYTLNIVKNPNVGGNVAPNVAPNCNAGTQYPSGTDVVLTASANTGYAFSSWGGCDTSTGTTCNVKMDAIKNVTATFSQCYTLQYVASPISGGSVTANPSPNCGTQYYLPSTSVVLTAKASTNYTLSNWSFCDSPSGATCTMTMNGNKNVTAIFASVPPQQTAVPTSTSLPAATGTPVPLATITPLLGGAVATATSTPKPPSTLPTTGSSPLTLIAIGLLLVLVVVGARVIRQSPA